MDTLYTHSCENNYYKINKANKENVVINITNDLVRFETLKEGSLFANEYNTLFVKLIDGTSDYGNAIQIGSGRIVKYYFGQIVKEVEMC